MLGAITTLFLTQMMLLSGISKVIYKTKIFDVFWLEIEIDEKDTERIKKIIKKFNCCIYYGGENSFIFVVKRDIQFTRLLCTLAKFNIDLKGIAAGDLLVDSLKVTISSKIPNSPISVPKATHLVSWSSESETKHLYIVKYENILKFIKEIKNNNMYIAQIF
jgi:hypothetical protein